MLTFTLWQEYKKYKHPMYDKNLSLALAITIIGDAILIWLMWRFM